MVANALVNELTDTQHRPRLRQLITHWAIASGGKFDTLADVPGEVDDETLAKTVSNVKPMT